MWLQGDNTLNSNDSRHYGPVPYALLKGRAFVRLRVCCVTALAACCRYANAVRSSVTRLGSIVGPYVARGSSQDAWQAHFCM